MGKNEADPNKLQEEAKQIMIVKKLTVYFEYVDWNIEMTFSSLVPPVTLSQRRLTKSKQTTTMPKLKE